MKVYVVVDQDYDIVTDVTVYSDKQFILTKLYNEHKSYIKSLKSTDTQKQRCLDNLETQYKNENLVFFRIFEKDLI